MCDGNGNCTCGGNSSLNHSFLAEIRSNPMKELMGINIEIEDSPDVKKARELIKEKGSTEKNLLNLSTKLCLQLRYQEAIEVLTEALKINPNSYTINRLLAIRYLTTCQNDLAYDAFCKLAQYTDDELDIQYRVSLCLFYQEKYEESLEFFSKCLDLSKERPEMYIASLYWYIFAKVMLKQDISKDLSLVDNLKITHHLGYLYAIKLFKGEDVTKLDELASVDNLTKIMYLFGKYHYYIYLNKTEEAKIAFKEAIDTDEYWASFSGLGVWNIYLRKNKQK